MEPHNDIKNPYIWLIGISSAIPSILIVLVMDFYLKANLNFILSLFIVTFPIVITYYVLWNIYKKSGHYRRKIWKK